MDTIHDKYQTLQKLVEPRSSDVEVIELAVDGWIDGSSWLSRNILLIFGWFQADAPHELEFLLERDEKTVPVEAKCFSYAFPEAASYGLKKLSGCVLVAYIPDEVKGRGEHLGRLTIRTDATTLALGPDDLARTTTELGMLLHSRIAALDSVTRFNLMAFVLSVVFEAKWASQERQLYRSLFELREALRPHLPHSLIALDQPQGLNIDKLMWIDDTRFYVRGWMRDGESISTSLIANSPEGSRVEIVDHLFRCKRPDVERFYGASSAEQFTAKSGFISCFELPFPSRLNTGWLLEMHSANGNGVEANAPPLVTDRDIVRDTIFGDLALEHRTQDDLMANHVFPAMSRLQELHQKSVAIASVDGYGRSVDAADISILVPLYGRIDFLEQQLAQFAHDPHFQHTDLIYILDSPELADRLRDNAPALAQLYGVPFRIVTLKQNAGYAGANNMGASVAIGRHLLLLNSDVLPDKPGWLEKMVNFYDSTPKIGAVGPKLLYEDDSLQHAGMYFSRVTGTNLWENRHYFKGLHRALPGANVTRRVPAVTGACLLVGRELYQEVGGIHGLYVQGDYEDSDFCFRLMEMGYEHWYLPDAELYHLEGQSYPSATRQQNSRFNMWLHTRLWNQQIEAVMRAGE